jgi:hypothetical protein
MPLPVSICVIRPIVKRRRPFHRGTVDGRLRGAATLHILEAFFTIRDMQQCPEQGMRIGHMANDTAKVFRSRIIGDQSSLEYSQGSHVDLSGCNKGPRNLGAMSRIVTSGSRPSVCGASRVFGGLEATLRWSHAREAWRSSHHCRPSPRPSMVCRQPRGSRCSQTERQIAEAKRRGCRSAVLPNLTRPYRAVDLLDPFY